MTRFPRYESSYIVIDISILTLTRDNRLLPQFMPLRLNCPTMLLKRCPYISLNHGEIEQGSITAVEWS
jgi:hypothetical protein